MGWMGGDGSSSSASSHTSPPSQGESPTSGRKRKITRTRTGCQTCRDRKVKCGEEKPECLNCQRTNHICPGYAPATVYKSARTVRRESGSAEDIESKIPTTVIMTTSSTSTSESTVSYSPASTDSMEDLRLLHYYTVDLAHTLSLPGAIGRTWADGVPRLAFGGDHEYLVHALLAIAAAHKASRDQNDIQSRERGQLHYGQSLALLQKLDLNSGELHASAALAAVMLLTWYESLSRSVENGLMHIQGAAYIVRDHHADLLKTPTGRRLFHLFTRLELSASLHLRIQSQFTTETSSAAADEFWEKAQFDLETLTIDDMYNGNSDFEYAWTQMMKIMIPVTVLRMVPQTGNRGTEDRKSEFEKIKKMLHEWESNLPASFMSIDSPETTTLPPAAILQQLEPIYYGSLAVAVAMALYINAFTLTHRGDEPRQDTFYQAVERTLRICLGAQRMRQIGLFQVYDGGDFGILWPIVIAGIWAPQGVIREWIQNLLSNWPREGMLDPFEVKVCLDAMWSRMDLGYGVEGLRNETNVRTAMESGQPVEIHIFERCQSGRYRGWLRKVEMTLLHDGEKNILEMPWHPGEMPLERVTSNTVNNGGMILPP